MLSSAPVLDSCVAGTDDLEREREEEFERAPDSSRRKSIRATGRLHRPLDYSRPSPGCAPFAR